MDNNKLKISIKTLNKLSNVLSEVESYSLLRRKAMYENYSLSYPKLHSMNLEEWNLLDFDTNDLLEIDNSDFNKEDYADVINFDENSITIVQKNNSLKYVNIPDKYKNQIIVNDIFSAMKENKNLLEVFGQIASPEKNKLTSQHYVLLNSGIYIELLDNANIDVPVQYTAIVDNDKQSFYNHVAINVGKNSQLNFIENYISPVSNRAFNMITEVLAKENSNINYSSVTNFNSKQRGTIVRNGITQRSAILNWNIATMDNADVFCDNTTNIIGDGSESNLKLVTLGTGKQKIYFNSELVNQGLNTNGDILQHGVLLDESHIVFNGVGFIVKGATSSNAYQSSRLLTLSDKAKADANPMLLIDENDVAAGHGASLGKIDEEQIYYLNSRGLSRKEASRLLVHGFLSPVIEKLKVDKVKLETISLIDEKINKVSE
ncbi:Fe-S cluster assembly protein SufD [Gemella sp. GH3]|uniref:Fe-S cluster assembly protein SufD n=1 Tax=unclassified Gemella TaxID=2624949 RepID=UPI0015D0B12E|nr:MULTISPECIES: Fe-S cluster assembly protein SufD [unclassified Gemella]MBF0714375.1 Fe-S cluster assembly protein SufD [Gemella sp. GH3.1]NYS51327.1 Fe-S cluster assembly protein SufD [Gemella sp. GH3]